MIELIKVYYFLFLASNPLYAAWAAAAAAAALAGNNGAVAPGSGPVASSEKLLMASLEKEGNAAFFPSKPVVNHNHQHLSSSFSGNPEQSSTASRLWSPLSAAEKSCTSSSPTSFSGKEAGKVVAG